MSPAPQLSHWSDRAWVRVGANWSSEVDTWFRMIINKKFPYSRNLDNIYIFGRKSVFL